MLENKKRREKKDVFHAFLVKNAIYDGDFEIPRIIPTNSIPNKTILFSKISTSKDYDAWVVFYEHDYRFIQVWNNALKYVPLLKKFKGVISPDFSIYRNMPLSMQIWNTYKGKALAHFWQENGIDVIANVRFGDERTYYFCFSGVPKNSVVAVGTHGCIKKKVDRKYFKKGLNKLVYTLNPHTIVVYGHTPNDLFSEYKENGISIITLPSDTSQFFTSKKEVE